MSQNIVSRMMDRAFRSGVALAQKMLDEKDIGVSVSDLAVEVSLIARESGINGTESRWAGYLRGVRRKAANWAEYNSDLSAAQQYVAVAVAERIVESVYDLFDRASIDLAWLDEQEMLYTP